MSDPQDAGAVADPHKPDADRPIRVALIGCGVVGSAVARLLHDHADDLASRIGRPLQLVGIGVRRPGRDRASAGVDPTLFTTDSAELVTRADIVVEVIGGIEPARSLILSAMEHGASVVTANKALLAEDGPTLYAAAAQYGVDLYYEAAVAGAIPLLRPLRESLAGDSVRKVIGIVNGTTNYVLDKMDTTGAGFADAVSQAQALGYAEADPTADVEGFDAAAKAAQAPRPAPAPARKAEAPAPASGHGLRCQTPRDLRARGRAGRHTGWCVGSSPSRDGAAASPACRRARSVQRGVRRSRCGGAAHVLWSRCWR